MYCSETSTILGLPEHSKSKPVARTKMAKKQMNCLEAIDGLALMTRHGVPSVQSLTFPVKACHTFT